MRAVIQRVSHASVTINGILKSSINRGMLLLVGFEATDTADELKWMVRKISLLRIFDDANGVMNVNIADAEGELMAISQFTLYASYRKGNRPSWLRAAPGPVSEPLYNEFCRLLSEATGKPVAKGVFGADMKVELLNDGPVTICMDSKHPE